MAPIPSVLARRFLKRSWPAYLVTLLPRIERAQRWVMSSTLRLLRWTRKTWPAFAASATFRTSGHRWTILYAWVQIGRFE